MTVPHSITIDGDTMLRQAKMTAHDYLLSAVHDIDEVLGTGTARKHPELIAAYLQTAAIDCGATIIAQQVRAGLEDIADATSNGLQNIADALSTNGE